MIDSQGYKHYIYHSRPGQLPKGYRVTISLRKVGDPDEYTIGIAVCSPDDRFVKKVGVTKATGRAMMKEAEVFLVPDRNDMVSKMFRKLSDQIKRGKVNPHH